MMVLGGSQKCVFWRRRRDSNPRYRIYQYDGLANRWFQPLTHVSGSQRRAVERSGLTGRELLAWKQTQAKVCHWCGKKCAKRFHVDHYIPLSKGGLHVVENLVIACMTCNLEKHAKDPFDFAREKGRLL